MNKILRKQSRRGFSLVELLAVVLVLAVLAAVAIPLYTSQRQSAAGRACKANLASIASALSAYALRNGGYPDTGIATLKTAYVANATTGGLVGAPEGMTEMPKCPLGQDYVYTKTGSACKIECSNGNVATGAHNNYPSAAGTASEWVKSLAAPSVDALP